ncbi:hypothetical protein ACM26V_16020 [Salipaludibacillus sp. HK11]|uniref:hypothetical protein n=1 Tax=Salipaludibacillus sp. HK11 TaxID=3394320 RepID=UPI0039FCD7E4
MKKKLMLTAMSSVMALGILGACGNAENDPMNDPMNNDPAVPDNGGMNNDLEGNNGMNNDMGENDGMNNDLGENDGMNNDMNDGMNNDLEENENELNG